MKVLPILVLAVAAMGFGCASEQQPQPQAQFQPVPPPDNALPGVHPRPTDAEEARGYALSQESVKKMKEEDRKAEREAKKKAKEEAEEQKAIITPDNGLLGKVATYNDAGRFVVLTIPVEQMPQNDTVLFIYRENLKVGEVRITGPQRDDNIVADVVDGEAQAGDEVRDK